MILDDLMYTTARDFILIYRGWSRNLSVIAFSQNLYYNKDPTQRRNCHSLVLFNNPGERCKSWLWLDRCIPRIPPTYFETFKKAPSKYNGYPLIDLKPTTPENLRLRTFVFFPMKSNKTGNIAYYFEKGIDQIWTFSEEAEASISSRDAPCSQKYLNLLSPIYLEHYQTK